MITPSELERHAYIAGNNHLADAYAALDTVKRLDDELHYFDLYLPMDNQIEKHVNAEIKKHIEEHYPDYAAYAHFFEDCFERLNAQYPCPEVTSDYDCSVIFDAITKGEGITE